MPPEIDAEVGREVRRDGNDVVASGWAAACDVRPAIVNDAEKHAVDPFTDTWVGSGVVGGAGAGPEVNVGDRKRLAASHIRLVEVFGSSLFAIASWSVESLQCAGATLHVWPPGRHAV
jgi:hypothetical protein